MSFQDSVIKEIADMTTTTSPLWKFVIVYPLLYKAEIDDEYRIRTQVEQTTIILDYETFKKGYRVLIGSPKKDWKELTNGEVDRFDSRVFHMINKDIEGSSYREGITLDDAYVTILSRTLLN